MKVLITGSNGMLGHDLIDVLNDKHELILTTSKTLDITDKEHTVEFIKENKPDIVINSAAYTDVDGCEENRERAFSVNGEGVRNLAIGCREADCPLVHISTDYVFNGKNDTPWVEDDEIGPISVYGKSKLEGEQAIQEILDKFFIVRTAWLYGDGKNFVKTMLNLSETHDEVSVVCDQLGSPTSAVELAKAIHHFEGTENYGLYHATCEGDTNWADFTEEIFKRAGKSTKVNHVTSKQYKQMNPAAADRPAYSILDNYMMRLADGYQMADWKDALDVYMAELK